MKGLVGPAGGLRYHYRARRYRASHWAPFVEPLAAWLLAWQPRSPRLCLIGPSGGYCLPGALLARFRTIDAVEPDPLARAILLRRFPALAPRVAWVAEDFFAPVRGALDPGRLGALFARFPDHAILFANVLGQLECVHPAAFHGPSFPVWARALVRHLDGREWASFHDRLSGTGPLPAGAPAPLTLPGRLDSEALARRLFARTPGPLLVLEAHRTADLFPGLDHLERRILVWEIEPGAYHVVEGVRSP